MCFKTVPELLRDVAPTSYARQPKGIRISINLDGLTMCDPVSHLIDYIEVLFQRRGGLPLPRQTVENISYAKAKKKRDNVLVAWISPSVPSRRVRFDLSSRHCPSKGLLRTRQKYVPNERLER